MPSAVDKLDILCLMGPTAVGKTSTAIELAQKLNGEIVTCDSVQVYRYMDIGSAKPSIEERQGVPHHLIDMVLPGQEYNAAQYMDDARQKISEITARAKLPIVTGGTGLYLRTLLYGIIDAPRANPDLRERFMAHERGQPGYLRAYLKERDPQAANSIEGNNIPRLLRAVEIYELSGEKPSALWARHGFKQSYYKHAPVFVLDGDNQWLKARIEQREKQMLDMGLEDEIQTVWDMGVSKQWRVWKAVTYRQVVEYMLGEISRAELVPAMVKANWQYARRQRTWFKKVEQANWIQADTGDSLSKAIIDRLMGSDPFH